MKRFQAQTGATLRPKGNRVVTALAPAGRDGRSDGRKERATEDQQNGHDHDEAGPQRPADEGAPADETAPADEVPPAPPDRPAPAPSAPDRPAAPPPPPSATAPEWPPAPSASPPEWPPPRPLRSSAPPPPLGSSDEPPLGPSQPPAHELPGPPPLTPWGWAFALSGLAVAFGPELLLYLASLGVKTAATAVTVGSAVALAIGSLVMYGWETFAAWLFSIRLRGNTLAAWGFRKPTRAYFWTIPLALLVVYVVSVVHDTIIHPKQQAIVSDFPHNTAGIVLFVLVAVVMAPLFEEMFFRGFLFQGLSQSFGWGWGAAGSAAIFAAAHLQLSVFVPLFALGVGLAWVFKRTGSLWTNITLHALFNAISVLAWALTVK